MRFILTVFLVVTGGCCLYFAAKTLLSAIVRAFGTTVRIKNNKNNKNK